MIARTYHLITFALGLLLASVSTAADPALPHKAQELLKNHCYRCHGKEGNIEGGLNYVLDSQKLIARGKVLPGNAQQSPLYKRVAAGKMPPPGEGARLSPNELAVLKQWIDAGAISPTPVRPERTPITEAAVFALIRDDLDHLDRRARRFTRYLSLHPQYNLNLSADELQTYRNALAKLLNSLSWHPRVTLPKPIDPAGVVLRFDLRDFLWDANLWNRLVADYPYAVVHDTAEARAAVVGTASRVPCVRADWFLATASRAPLYYELLQIPGNAAELERQLRVDVALNIQQERIARAGFNGSGISRNNRILERHDAVHGAYWRTYDFEAVPQNLIERDLLLPDRRNIFAYPLGPGGTENTFQHAGGEIIFNLPNGLHAYMLVNADNNRLDKGPIAIVSDPRRPDRAVEAGVSCMGCHITGILQKSDQIRAHVEKNTKAFTRADRDLIKALYPPEAKMKSLMDEDADRFQKAVTKTGNKISTTELISTMTLRYEADVDLATVAAEFGLTPQDFQRRVLPVPAVNRNLGGLRVQGGTVSRQVVAQAFGDIARALHLGAVVQPGTSGQSLPDNTGEVDPLETQSSPANSLVFSRDGRRALFASADKSVRLWDVETARDLRRFIGHTASVWSVAFSPDGRRALSGGADTVVRLWDVDTGNELHRLEGHEGLITAVAFSPDGKQALTAGLDHLVILWDLEGGKEIRRFEKLGRYINQVVFLPQARQALLCADRVGVVFDIQTGKVLRELAGHQGAITAVAVAPEGRQVATASDDRSLRLWDLSSGKVLRSFLGHESYVKCVAFSPDGKQLVSGGTDQTVRLWEVATGKELRQFTRHQDSVIQATFAPEGRATLSGSRDATILVWPLIKKPLTPATVGVEPRPDPVLPAQTLRPANTIPLRGTIGPLVVSPNGKWVYWLNLAERKLSRLDTARLQTTASLALSSGTELLFASPSRKSLLTFAPQSGKTEALLQIIDPVKWTVVKTHTLPTAPYDAVADDNGRAYFTGATGEWTDVTAFDLNRGVLLGRWGGVWNRSLVRLSTDQKKLYLSTQGVSPGAVDALVLPEKMSDKPATWRSPALGQLRLGGEFLATPDGRFLVLKNGSVLRTSTERAQDLQPAGRIEPFLAAAFAVQRGVAFTCSADGWLRRYAYPSWKLEGAARLEGVGYQAQCDDAGDRLYLAVFDPHTLTSRTPGRNGSELHIYEVKTLLQQAARKE